MTTSSGTLAALLTAAALGCSDSPAGPTYEPVIPTQWASSVNNAFFPLVPGAVYEYEGQTSEGLERVVVEVLTESRQVNGVTAAIVRDRVYVAGALVEDTYDWYAQDVAGNVWYLGEDSKEIRNGVVVSTEGSWEWGVDGALPGIIMWADPAAHIGEEYRQEFYRGEAEDFGKVLAIDQSVTVPSGTFTGCVKTFDYSGLDPDALEHKFYCPQIGFVLEIAVESSERLELTGTTNP